MREPAPHVRCTIRSLLLLATLAGARPAHPQAPRADTASLTEPSRLLYVGLKFVPWLGGE